MSWYVAAARQEAGPDVDRLVDGGWYGVTREEPFRPRLVKERMRLVPQLEETGIVWLEDFSQPDNLQGYAAVAAVTRSLSLAAGEQYATFAEFEQLADVGRVDILQPDLTRCGGLTVGRQIADFAARRQIACVPPRLADRPAQGCVLAPERLPPAQSGHASSLAPLLPDRKNCGFVGRARTARWMEMDYRESLTRIGLLEGKTLREMFNTYGVL